MKSFPARALDKHISDVTQACRRRWQWYNRFAHVIQWFAANSRFVQNLYKVRVTRVRNEHFWQAFLICVKWQDCGTDLCEHNCRKVQCKVTDVFHTSFPKSEHQRQAVLICDKWQESGTGFCEHNHRKSQCKVRAVVHTSFPSVRRHWSFQHCCSSLGFVKGWVTRVRNENFWQAFLIWGKWQQNACGHRSGQR